MIPASFILGAVESIEIPLQDKHKITILLSERSEFGNEKPLEDYIYSIRRVTNYSGYKRHFARKYSRITDLEYEAIVDDNIYKERTYLGVIINAMHEDHQRSFVTYLAAKKPSLLAGSPDCEEAFHHLKNYLDYAILKPAEYLQESYQTLENMVPKSELSTLAIGERSHFIERQNKVIEEELNMFRGILDTIDLSRFDSSQYKNYFRNIPLPIQIK